MRTLRNQLLTIVECRDRIAEYESQQSANVQLLKSSFSNARGNTGCTFDNA